MTNTDTRIEEMFAAGAHLGHKTNRVHPKSQKYIYTIENGVSIIDLTKTASLLEKALTFISNAAKEQKVMLLVLTKRVSSAFAADLCRENSIPFVSVKWPAGLLTNFEMIIKNAKKLSSLKAGRESGDWNKFVKHEQVKMAKDVNKLERLYGGLVSLTKKPDFLFVVDIKKEKNAVKEGKESKIPVVAITDTNSDPDQIQYPIPANDDSSTSIEYFVKAVIETYVKHVNIPNSNKPISNSNKQQASIVN